jgi:hypothetical protein
MSTRKLAINLAGCTGAVLLVMVVVSVVTGATQERHEHVLDIEQYALALLAHAPGLRALMALDIAFLVLYTAFFAALAKYLHARGQPFTRLAFGAMLATAVLDIVEDHHIIAMLESAEHGVLPAARSLTEQATLSMTKFSISYLALFMFGLAIPRTTKLGLALCLFLTVGTLLSAVIGYSLPPAHQASFESGRWIGFLAGFVLAVAWLLKQPDEPEAVTSSAAPSPA